MPKSVPFETEGVVILSHQRLRARQIRNQARRRKFVLIETDAISAPVVRKSTFVDPVDAFSHSACVPSMGHVRIRAKSPFDILFWEQNLRNHPDAIFVQTILDGIRFGVKVGYDGPQMSLECDNRLSSIEHYDEVSEIIRKNVECGRVSGPFPSPLLQIFFVVPLGPYPKNLVVPELSTI